MVKKIDAKLLHGLLVEFCRGRPVVKNPKGFNICCPWHDDHNPSCTVFYGTGIFCCFVCHGDRKKGKKGIPPVKGFMALGMSETRAKAIFLGQGSSSDCDAPLSFERPPSLLDLTAVEEFELKKARTHKFREDKVVKREEWPKYWGFRSIDYSTLISPWFRDRFSPTKVFLKKETLPRIAFAIGGAEEYKDIDHPNYLRHEVYLRLSTSVKAKAINSIGLNLDLDVTDPLPATLFGLINNKLRPNCRGVILVEGPMDAMVCLQHIHRLNYDLDVIALLGTPQWSNVLMQLKMYIIPQMKDTVPFILAFDHDAAGSKLTCNAIKDIQSEFYFSETRIKILDYPADKKDPGDVVDANEFSDCIKKLNVVCI